MSDTKCKTCRYAVRFSVGAGGRAYCNYLGITGRARQKICPPGDECTVYEKRRGRMVNDIIIRSGVFRAREIVEEGEET